MIEPLRFIVGELNREPFSRAFSLATFDSLHPLRLLQLLNDVLSDIDPEQDASIRSETREQTLRRTLALLRILAYPPPSSRSDASRFRRGLMEGSKDVIHPLLHWLLERVPELKKRVYLADFLIKVEVPEEFLQDDIVQNTYRQYEDLLEIFKASHREREKLLNSQFSTAEIRRDISAMENEKEQLIKRLERLKKRVEVVPNYQQLLEQARRLREVKERQGLLAQQKYEQQSQLFQAKQRHQRLEQQLREVRQASANANPQSLMNRFEEEIMVNSYMVSEKLPKELEAMRHTVQFLHKVASEPAMGQAEVQELRRKIKEVDYQINQLIKKRMMRNDPTVDKLTPYRKQVSIMKRKKESIAEELQEAKRELATAEMKLKQRTSHTKVPHATWHDELLQLRTKEIQCKEKREEISKMKAENEVLQQSEENLKQQLETTKQNLQTVESERGISGHADTQEELERMSAIASRLNQRKSYILTDMSEMVNEFNAVIMNKSSLAPLVKELKSLRQQHQDLSLEHEQAKGQYERYAACLKNESSMFEQDVKALREETEQQESQYHYIRCMSEIVEMQMQRAAEEMKAYVSTDPQERKKTIRDMYLKNISEQEARYKTLCEQRKMLRPEPRRQHGTDESVV